MELFVAAGGGGVEEGKGFEGTKLIALEEMYWDLEAEDEVDDDLPVRPDDDDDESAAADDGASEIWNKTSAILVATCWSNT